VIQIIIKIRLFIASNTSHRSKKFRQNLLTNFRVILTDKHTKTEVTKIALKQHIHLRQRLRNPNTMTLCSFTPLSGSTVRQLKLSPMPHSLLCQIWYLCGNQSAWIKERKKL